ncbi:MAG: hypothetical protein MUC83_08340 [Pirellula sp.]|nr:hypothetical protein [Pirellula sp.]
MKISKIEVTKRHLKWVTWSVILATILFVIASLNPALNRLDQTAFAILNAARYLMLGCFVTLAVGLVWYRENTPEKIAVLVTNSEIICGPCDRENVWIVSAEDLVQLRNNQPISPLAGDLRKIQVVVIRSKSLPNEVMQTLLQLKHLSVLDVQGSVVPANFWGELEVCRDLEYILACGAVEQGDVKQLHMTLPEAKFFLDRRSLVISNRAST